MKEYDLVIIKTDINGEAIKRDLVGHVLRIFFRLTKTVYLAKGQIPAMWDQGHK